MQKGFWGTLFMIASLTALPITLLSSLLATITNGVDFRKTLDVYIWFGISFGLFLGFVTAFFLKAYKVVVLFHNREIFVTEITEIAQDLGFHPNVQMDNYLTFTPPISTSLLSGEVSIQISEGSATITGPAAYVKKIYKRIS